ncbi:MAG TPA: nitroreductase [Sphingobium sp.]
MNVSEAVASRRSVRGFLDKPVDLDLLRDILTRATRAPSGGNLQPWNLHIVAGDRMTELRALMARRLVEAPDGEGAEYDIYPKALGSPYRERRFGVGEALYARLGIPREDKEGRKRWFARNFQFFGAPVALFCYVDRSHGAPQWSDCGMLLQTVMLLLREAGLGSCPQECWALYAPTIGGFLGAPPEQMLFTGMSIGWSDPAEAANALETPRAPIEDVVHFHVG